MPASTFQSESFQKMLVIGVQAKDLHLLFIKNYYKVMEKNSERGYCIPLFRKTKRIMKITTLFSLGVACCISASTYAQNYKVSINKQNSSIIEILREIEKSSEFTFFFNDNRVNVNKTVSVNAQNATLEDVLENKKTVTGVILDESGLPVIGANVVEKGTTNGTITDAEGRFSLNVASDATLREVLP